MRKAENRFEWHNNYVYELKDLFDIVEKEILRKFPKTNINTEIAFHNFSRLMYHCSSKDMSDYTHARYLNDKNLIINEEEK